jgi:hypothetical protein
MRDTFVFQLSLMTITTLQQTQDSVGNLMAVFIPNDTLQILHNNTIYSFYLKQHMS